MPTILKRLGDGWSMPKAWAMRARMKAIAAAQLQQADQDEHDRHVLDIIGVGADPPQQRLVAAVAEPDPELAPDPADTGGEPDEEQGAGAGEGERDRQDHDDIPSLGQGNRTRPRGLQPLPNAL